MKATYTLVDGEIGWNYRLQFKADGALDRIAKSKFDAKEIDPKFQGIIKAVTTEAEAEMKQNGAYGKFGSVHGFWRMKMGKLSASGFSWRSPAELNQGTIYD